MELLDTWLDSNLKDSFILDTKDLRDATKTNPTKIPQDDKRYPNYLLIVILIYNQ